ncbi:molybdenum cofactor biosynthesis protein B [Demequina sp. NBRC 110052]|uniref:MogA/MoaB family molybdenum cofactor biosynthesis protein n=1 Tax=Demequina sp. NBRC 110052 TaxID=1570341 RepID=UPI000A062FA9|nr:MogA/MoaB family molybdenum cofactor biosynthesis protein [Demequina sp. NBRC 110052]
MSPALTGVLIAVVTVSDRSSRGERVDASGPILAEALRSLGAEVWATTVPDGADQVEHVIRAAVAEGARVVLTSGGTGIGPRDLTPEGTANVIARPLPGIAERLRAVDADAVPGAVLSRGLAGLTGGTHPAIVINVAGSTEAARSAAAVLADVLPHALSQLDGEDH